MKSTCASVAVLLLITAALPSGAAQDDVVRAEKAWAAALLKSDVQALDQLLAPELIFTHANGVVEDKDVLLGNIKSGALRYQVVEHEAITVKPYNDAAVLHGRIRLGGVADGKPFSVYVVMTHLWINERGAWKLAAHHATLLP
jgi:ketosteroid isomerase-like protein